LLEIEPETVSCDCHPDYFSGRIARTLSYSNLEQVYHHHAHMASCMAENMMEGPVIAIICDGTGYGIDETVWGGEVLSGGYLDFRREYHLEQIPMPGGEAAIRHPLRMAISYLFHHLGKEGKEWANRIFPGREGEVEIVCAMLKKGFNSPLTSSCGRLYDAVSALLGVCFENSYDGQAPLQLAEKAWAESGSSYPFSLRNNTIETGQLVRCLLADLARGLNISLLAACFQQTVTEMFTAAAVNVREKTGIRQVVLSGGCFQNPFLLSSMTRRLQDEGLEVFRHRMVPANDGGLALGQAVVAAWRRYEAACV
jgi:hydrogenase maturation protein HypF